MHTAFLSLSTNKSFLFLFFFYIACLLWTGTLQNEPEELWHGIYCSWGDSFHAAANTYMAVNPRIGEMAFYFIGDNIRVWMLLLNPVMLTLAVVCMYRIGTGKWPDNSWRAVLTLAFIAFALFAFHSGVYWFLANFNWLFPCTLALLFFCLCERFFKGEFRMGWGRVAVLSVLAFVVGMSNQNTSLISLLLFAGAGLYWKFRFKKGWGWAYPIILFFLLLGVGLFFCAPAHGGRAEMEGWKLTFDNILFHSILFPANWGYFFISFCRLFIVAAVLLIWLFKDKSILKTPRLLLLALAFFLLWGILMLAPAWGAPRAYCPMDLVLASLLAGVFHHKAGMSKSWVAPSVVFTVHAALMLTWIVPMFQLEYRRYQVWRHIEDMAEDVKAQGGDTLVIRPENIDIHEHPLSRFCSMPHSIIPYKTEVGYLAIPFAGEKSYDYINATDEQQWRGNNNCEVARRLGLKGLIWISSPNK